MSIQNPWELPINQLSMSNYGGFDVGQTFESPQQKMLRRANAVRGQTNIGGGELIVPDDFGAPREKRQAPITGGDQLAILKARRQSAPGLSQIMGAKTPSRGGALAKALAAGATAYMGRRTNEQDAQALKASIQAQRDREADALAAEKELEADRYLQEQIYQRRRDAVDDEAGEITNRYNEARIIEIGKTDPMGAGKTMYNPKNGQSDTYRPSSDGSGTWVDSDGEKASLNGLLDYAAYKKALSDENKDVANGDLTENQLRLGMSELEKKTQPMQAIHDRISVIDNLLAPYMVGSDDEREGQGVPGIGFGEGYRGFIGDAWRMAQGQDSRQINAAMAGLTADEIRQQAGTAQTLHETRNVLASMSQQGLSEEGAALAMYMRIRDAFQKDLQLLEAGTHKGVMNEFRRNYQAIGGESIFDNYLKPIDFAQVEKVGGDIPSAVSESVLDEAGLTQEEWNAASEADKDLLAPGWRD
ncbi:MAG: hypothetical protein HN738_08525 [Gammaproteobacteria bacterium]|jgi:hypothetical protein|nr:hypothetical protein [Gammaproteobacteria bacterium]